MITISKNEDEKLKRLLKEDFVRAMNQITRGEEKHISILKAKNLRGKYFTFKLVGKTFDTDQEITSYKVQSISKSIVPEVSPKLIELFNKLFNEPFSEMELYIRVWYDINDHKQEINDWMFDGQYILTNGKQKNL